MLSIEQYVCNIIAGNKYITNLYFGVDRARDIQNKDNRFQKFDKRIIFPGIGTKVYRSTKLVEFENLSYNLSYQCIINQDIPALDKYIILLLKGRNTIRGLYQACCRAKILREDAKTFCYTFVNPFGSLTDVSRSRLTFKSAFDFITFFCQCERTKFDASLVFNNVDFD